MKLSLLLSPIKIILKVFFTKNTKKDEQLFLSELKDLCNKLQQKQAQLKLEKKYAEQRYQCLETVLSTHQDPMYYEFQITHKGIPVLLCQQADNSHILIYNLNNNPTACCMLSMRLNIQNTQLQILEIKGGMGLGHGKLAIDKLLQLCRQYQIKEINARFTTTGPEQLRHLKRFFDNWGFELNLGPEQSCLLQKTL